MDSTAFFKHFELLAGQADAVAKMRKLILQLAAQGRLIARKPNKSDLDWREVRLDELGDWALGCGFPTAEQGHTDKPILFAKVSDMNLPGNEKCLETANNTIDEAAAKRLRVKVHPAGTVVFPKIGGAIATNKRRLIVRPTAIDNNCLGIIPSRQVDSDWLYLLLTSMDFAQYQSGTSVPALNQSTLGEISVLLPPLAEQRRIVAKVDELMALCDELEHRQQARQHASGLLQQSALHHLLAAREPQASAAAWRRVRDHFHLLHDTPDAIPQLRQAILQLAVQGCLESVRHNEPSPKGLLDELHRERSSLVKKKILRQSKIPPTAFVERDDFVVPGNWAFVTFNHISEASNNAIKAGPFGSSLKKSDYVADGFKIYGQEQVIAGDASIGDYYISREKFQQLESCAVKPNDVLISLVGTIGKVLILPKTIKPGIINPRLLKVSLEQRVASGHYIALVLESPHAKSFFSENSHGGTMEILNLDILCRLVFPLPPLAEQKRIVARVEELLRWCDTLEAQLHQTRTLGAHLLASTLHHLLAA